MRIGDVAVRPFRDESADYARMAGWLSDEHVLRWYEGRDKPFDLTQAEAKYGPRARNEEAINSCFIEHCGRPVGYLQHYPVAEAGEYGLEDSTGLHAIDLFIGEVEVWGKGIGTMAVRAVVRHLLDHAGAIQVLVDPQVGNARAIRCYEKAGFATVKILPKHELHEGQHRDCWLMATDGT
jgi:aminoglycoside 6'-N-acetyltransferase